MCFFYGALQVKKINGRQGWAQRRRCEDYQLSGVSFGRKMFRDICFLLKKDGFVLG